MGAVVARMNRFVVVALASAATALLALYQYAVGESSLPFAAAVVAAMLVGIVGCAQAYRRVRSGQEPW